MARGPYWLKQDKTYQANQKAFFLLIVSAAPLLLKLAFLRLLRWLANDNEQVTGVRKPGRGYAREDEYYFSLVCKFRFRYRLLASAYYNYQLVSWASGSVCFCLSVPTSFPACLFLLLWLQFLLLHQHQQLLLLLRFLFLIRRFLLIKS